MAFIGTFGLGIPALLFAFFTWREAKAGVTYEIIGSANVFDLHEPLKDLDISFGGRDIQEQNLNLRIMTVHVLNSGDVNILNDHYEQEADWGIQFVESEVITANLVGARSEHLWENVDPQPVGTDTVVFSKIVFDKGDFFTIEVLLLHPKGEEPNIASVGKISGIEQVTISTRPLAQQEVAFFGQIFPGSSLVHLVRTIIYLIGSVLALLTLLLGLIGVSDLIEKIKVRSRKRFILKSKTIRQLSEGVIKDFLVNLYSIKEVTGLREVRNAIEDPDGITWLLDSETLYVSHFSFHTNRGVEGVIPDMEMKWFVDRAIWDMQRNGILTQRKTK